LKTRKRLENLDNGEKQNATLSGRTYNAEISKQQLAPIDPADAAPPVSPSQSSRLLQLFFCEREAKMEI
jgi:hypothetical protein